jgi:hypothetical protein
MKHYSQDIYRKVKLKGGLFFPKTFYLEEQPNFMENTSKGYFKTKKERISPLTFKEASRLAIEKTIEKNREVGFLYYPDKKEVPHIREIYISARRGLELNRQDQKGVFHTHTLHSKCFFSIMDIFSLNLGMESVLGCPEGIPYQNKQSAIFYLMDLRDFTTNTQNLSKKEKERYSAKYNKIDEFIYQSQMELQYRFAVDVIIDIQNLIKEMKCKEKKVCKFKEKAIALINKDSNEQDWVHYQAEEKLMNLHDQITESYSNSWVI